MMAMAWVEEGETERGGEGERGRAGVEKWAASWAIVG
jgi:hypothetical protein